MVDSPARRRPASLWRRCVFLLWLSASTALPQAFAAEPASWGLEALMQERAAVDEARSVFHETKTSELLKAPLQTSGTLTYRAPDFLRKSVEQPYRQDFVVEGEVITITDDKGEQGLAVDDHPLLAGVIASFRALLAGDLDTLRRFYTLDFVGDRLQWAMTLTPVDERLGKELAHVKVLGAGVDIRRIETLTRSGDLSVMTIRPQE